MIYNEEDALAAIGAIEKVANRAGFATVSEYISTAVGNRVLAKLTKSEKSYTKSCGL